jgi:hypothetical protein
MEIAETEQGCDAFINGAAELMEEYHEYCSCTIKINLIHLFLIGEK